MHFAGHHVQTGVQGRTGQQGGGRQRALTTHTGKIDAYFFLRVVCAHGILPYRLRALKAEGAICRQTMQPVQRLGSTAKSSPWR